MNYPEVFNSGCRKQPRIRTYKCVDTAPIFQIQRDSKLKTIECTQTLALLWPVRAQQAFCFLVVGNEKTGNREQVASGICEKATAELVEFHQVD